MPLCPHCGFESGRGTVCPLCGTALATEAASDDPSPGDAPAWEDPQARFPANLFATWLQSLFDPATFFSRLPYRAPLARPLLYFLIITVLSAFFDFWWESLGVAARYPLAGLYEEAVWSESSALLGFFLSPFVGLGALFVSSLVVHLFVLMLAPDRQPLGATLRVLCYSVGPTLFAVVPFLGALVGGVWGLVLTIVGIREAHRTSTGRGVAIVLLPLLIAGFMVGFVLFLFVATLGISLIE
jgi:hypothetical protein